MHQPPAPPLLHGHTISRVKYLLTNSYVIKTQWHRDVCTHRCCGGLAPRDNEHHLQHDNFLRPDSPVREPCLFFMPISFTAPGVSDSCFSRDARTEKLPYAPHFSGAISTDSRATTPAIPNGISAIRSTGVFNASGSACDPAHVFFRDVAAIPISLTTIHDAASCFAIYLADTRTSSPVPTVDMFQEGTLCEVPFKGAILYT